MSVCFLPLLNSDRLRGRQEMGERERTEYYMQQWSQAGIKTAKVCYIRSCGMYCDHLATKALRCGPFFPKFNKATEVQFFS